MLIDWQHFTPIQSLSGGLLIGIAVTILLVFNGRIAGISGIVGGLLSPTTADKSWRIVFVMGLLLSPVVWQQFQALPEIAITTNKPILIIAGLFVGIGTRLGSGCTSGHGVCGLSRLSTRSIIATLTFMALGFASTYFVRHVL